jgi:aspartate/methionine/tyrosine aminotransferase
MQAVQTPIIPVIGDWIRQTPDTLSLGQGIVHYGPPPEALARLQSVLHTPELNPYGPVVGLSALREVIADKLAMDNGIDLRQGWEIVVTAGSNMGFLAAVLAIASVGEEIILLAPYYFNHEMAIALAGCRAIEVPTNALGQPDLEHLAAAITPQTRAIVTISPNNPTGVVYPSATLAAINRLCHARGLFHISDEAYEYFVYDGAEHHSPAALPGSAGHTISLFSLSKSYGFAGWRIGYMLIPTNLLEAVRKVQDTNLICPPLACQQAAIGALQVGRTYIQPYLQQLNRVRQQVLTALQPLAPQVLPLPAQGAFYIFLKLQCDLDSLWLCQRLIEEFQIAVLPGSTFGATGSSLRLAYGMLDHASVSEAMRRLTRGLKALLSL